NTSKFKYEIVNLVLTSLNNMRRLRVVFMFVFIFAGIVNVREFFDCACEVAFLESCSLAAQAVTCFAELASIVLTSFCCRPAAAFFQSFYSSVGREAPAARPKFIKTIFRRNVE